MTEVRYEDFSYSHRDTVSMSLLDLIPPNYLNSILKNRETRVNRLGVMDLILGLISKCINELLSRTIYFNPLTGAGDCQILAHMGMEVEQEIHVCQPTISNLVTLNQLVSSNLANPVSFEDTRDKTLSDAIAQKNLNIDIPAVLYISFLLHALTISNQNESTSPLNLLRFFRDHCTTSLGQLSKNICSKLVHHWQKLLSRESVSYTKKVIEEHNLLELSCFIEDKFIQLDDNFRVSYPTPVSIKVFLEKIKKESKHQILVFNASICDVEGTPIYDYDHYVEFCPISAEFKSIKKHEIDKFFDQRAFIIKGVHIPKKPVSPASASEFDRILSNQSIEHVLLSNCFEHPDYVGCLHNAIADDKYASFKNSLNLLGGCSQSDASIFCIKHIYSEYMKRYLMNKEGQKTFVDYKKVQSVA